MPGPARLERGGRLRRGGVYGAFGGQNDAGILSLSAVGGAMSPVPLVATTVPGESITFPIAFATQHVYAHFDCEVDSEAVPAGNDVTFTMRIDGVVTDTRVMGDLVGSEVTEATMHSLYVALTPGNHTIDVQAQATVGDYAIPAGRSRLTIIVLPG